MRQCLFFIFFARLKPVGEGREHYVDYNGFIIAPNCSWHLIAPTGFNLVSPISKVKTASKALSAHKNGKNVIGNWVLYEIFDAITNEIYKVGIGDNDRKRANGQDVVRATDSERIIRDKKGHPNAMVKILGTFLGITKEVMLRIESTEVENKRNQGHSLPYNRERKKK